jgi:hypothetical protein
MSLQPFVQLQILFALTPALAGWMLATSTTQPMLARAFAAGSQVSYALDPTSRRTAQSKRSVGRRIAISIRMRRWLSTTSAVARPAHDRLPVFNTILSAFTRAP